MHAPATLRRLLWIVGVLGLALPAFCTDALADEIIVVDLDTGAKSRMRVHKVMSETWSEIKYIERPKARQKSVPTLTVVEIRRSDRSKDATDLANAMADLARGNYSDAATVFQNVCGGGFRDDAATGERTYTSFSAADPDNKRKRPTWTSEYAHYHYVKALLETAKAEKDLALFDEVLMALVDREYEAQEETPSGKMKTVKRKSGGFLDRFKGGNSRFYPHAMLAKAEALVGLGKFKEAQAAYDELGTEAGKAQLHPRWTYEALLGKGVIAQAQGDSPKAEIAYEGASAVMVNRMKTEQRQVILEAYGRLYSLGRTRVAEARLANAEKRNAPSAYKELRGYIQAGNPEALKIKHSTLSSKALKALIAGARHPKAQAVGLNATGLAYFFAEKNYDEALTAFKSVAVKYAGDPDQTSRAYFYIAKAAEAAANGAKNAEIKKMYVDMKDEARRVLRTQYRDSKWAKK